MLTLLISLSFNFDSIPSPQFIGDSFFVSVYASDSFVSTCSLSVEPVYCYMEICGEENDRINFKEGKWEGWVRIPLASDSVRLCCSCIEDGSDSGKSRQETTGDSIDIYPNPLTPEYGFVNIEYYLNDNARVLIMIFDKFGNPIWDTETDESAGIARARWDGTDNDGNRVISGVYIVCIKATNQTQIVARYTAKIAVVR